MWKLKKKHYSFDSNDSLRSKFKNTGTTNSTRTNNNWKAFIWMVTHRERVTLLPQQLSDSRKTTSKIINRCCFYTFKIKKCFFYSKVSRLNTSLFLRNNVKHRARNRLEMFRDHSERHEHNFIPRLKGSQSNNKLKNGSVSNNLRKEKWVEMSITLPVKLECL